MINTSHQIAWLSWLASEKRYGQNTLDAYERDLDDFSSYVKGSWQLYFTT